MRIQSSTFWFSGVFFSLFLIACFDDHLNLGGGGVGREMKTETDSTLCTGAARVRSRRIFIRVRRASCYVIIVFIVIAVPLSGGQYYCCSTIIAIGKVDRVHKRTTTCTINMYIRCGGGGGFTECSVCHDRDLPRRVSPQY